MIITLARRRGSGLQVGRGHRFGRTAFVHGIFRSCRQMSIATLPTDMRTRIAGRGLRRGRLLFHSHLVFPRTSSLVSARRGIDIGTPLCSTKWHGPTHITKEAPRVCTHMLHRSAQGVGALKHALTRQRVRHVGYGPVGRYVVAKRDTHRQALVSAFLSESTRRIISNAPLTPLLLKRRADTEWRIGRRPL